MKQRTLPWFAVIALLVCGTFIQQGAQGLRLEAFRDPLAVELVTQGLSQPMGMAIDPTSGLLHVAEQGRLRIVAIQDRVPSAVIDTQFTITADIPIWARSEARPLSDWTSNDLRTPADIAFDASGSLWVAEAGQRGRLLRFHRMEGQFAVAEAIVSPWLNESMGFSSVAVGPDQRLYAVMQSTEMSDGDLLALGRVIVRQPSGEWRLIDYGPFARFSNVQLSQDGSILLFAESLTADVTWYDTDREILFGAMERIAGVRHVALLEDGTTLAAIEREDHTWSLVELDPRYGRAWEWVGGLSAIGGLAVRTGNHSVYVSLPNEGRIMRVSRRGDRRIAPDNRLAGMIQQFEIENSLPPREWPAFFREFIERLGMLDATDEVMRSIHPLRHGRSPMSVEEFTSAIPVVAAKLKATLLNAPEEEPDPIEDISFVIFFPNQSVHTRQSVAPSVSLIRAKHRSGRIARTRFLPTSSGAPISENLDWDDLPEVLVSLPAGYHAEQTSLTESGLVRVYFLGMGLGPDYWLDIYRGNPNRSVMRVEHRDGRRLEYALEPYPEKPESGGEAILVAGLKDIESGWISLGSRPVTWNIARDEGPVFRVRNMERMERLGWSHADQPILRASERQSARHVDTMNFRRTVVLRAATRWGDVYF